MVSVLSATETPTGNVVILCHDGTTFTTMVACPDTEHVVSERQAREWYQMARNGVGTVCGPWPRRRGAA